MHPGNVVSGMGMFPDPNTFGERSENHRTQVDFDQAGI